MENLQMFFRLFHQDVHDDFGEDIGYVIYCVSYYSPREVLSEAISKISLLLSEDRCAEVLLLEEEYSSIDIFDKCNELQKQILDALQIMKLALKDEKKRMLRSTLPKDMGYNSRC